MSRVVEATWVETASLDSTSERAPGRWVRDVLVWSKAPLMFGTI
jgi:hypothetical protein